MKIVSSIAVLAFLVSFGNNLVFCERKEVSPEGSVTLKQCHFFQNFNPFYVEKNFSVHHAVNIVEFRKK